MASISYSSQVKVKNHLIEVVTRTQPTQPKLGSLT